MIIKELGLSGFGKFHNKKIRFDEGINIILGCNESGKSTLHKFIEGMLFGFFKDSWSRKVYSEDYDRYLPLKGSEYHGSMIIEDEGRRFRLERNFLKGRDDLRIFDEITGRDVTGEFYYDSGTRMYYFTDPKILNRNLFRNTVSVAQLKVKTDDELGKELKENFYNFSHSGTDVSVSKALHLLKRKNDCIGTERRKGTELNKLVEEIKILEDKLKSSERSRAKILELSSRKKNLYKDLEQLKEALKSKENSLENLEIKNVHKKYLSYKELLIEKEQLESQLNDYKYEYMEEEIFRDALLADQEIKRLTDEIYESKEYVEKLNFEIMRISHETNMGFEGSEYENMDEDRDRLFELNEEKEFLAGKLKLLKKKDQKKSLLPGIFAFLIGALTIYAGFTYNNPYILIVAGLFILFSIYSVTNTIKNFKNPYKLEEESLLSEIKEINEKIEDILKEYGVNNFVDLRERWKEIITTKSKFKEEFDRINVLRSRVAYVVEKEEILYSKLRGNESRLDQIFKDWNVYDFEGLAKIFERQKNLRRLGRRIEEIERTMEMIMAPEDFARFDNFFKGKGSIGEYKEDPNTIKEEIQKLHDTIKSTRTDLDKTEGEILAIEKESNDFNDIKEELSYLYELKNEQMEKSRAVEKAYDVIEKVSRDMHREIAPRLNTRLGQVMKSITGKYENLKVSDKARITLEDPETNKMIQGEGLSSGAMDQLYFSFRLGMIEMLKLEKFPLILDESFTQYDDGRMEKALKFLVEQCNNKQILLFSSQRRETSMLKDMNIEFNTIDLDEVE
ncbi:ATP-binding protein [Alkalibacter mobilis]|uniref:ATP-binding protein n=1 Tax=Alkalibacter mobilis TaxID=2787712 RepID=UPI0018A0E9AE|nr:AAA family ATPase [Alkalibacter mobilis]MBF7096602.1 AAA family ATPase [Alkalibacter mobilis]